MIQERKKKIFSSSFCDDPQLSVLQSKVNPVSESMQACVYCFCSRPNFMCPTQSINLRAWSRERFIVRGKENLQLMFKTPSSLIYLGEEFFLFFSCLFYLFLFNFYFYFILLYNTVLVLPYTDMNPPRVYMHSQP